MSSHLPKWRFPSDTILEANEPLPAARQEGAWLSDMNAAMLVKSLEVSGERIPAWEPTLQLWVRRDKPVEWGGWVGLLRTAYCLLPTAYYLLVQVVCERAVGEDTRFAQHAGLCSSTCVYPWEQWVVGSGQRVVSSR